MERIWPSTYFSNTLLKAMSGTLLKGRASLFSLRNTNVKIGLKASEQVIAHHYCFQLVPNSFCTIVWGGISTITRCSHPVRRAKERPIASVDRSLGSEANAAIPAK